jgi:hypothetical protein
LATKAIDDKGNSYDPKENFTVHLWGDLFNKEIFSDKTFFINSRQPPASAPGPSKSCDIIVKYLTYEWSHQILSFTEAKRARNRTGSKVCDLEVQATEYCYEFLGSNEDVVFVYTCTLVGPYV